MIVSFFVYYSCGIYLSGSKIMFIYDMRAEFAAYYGYLSHGGPGFDNLFHSMSGGLGGGFFGTASMYISVLDFVYCFVPMNRIPDALYVMSLLRVGLCGLSFSVYLNGLDRIKIKGRFVFLLSLCYALMSYNFAYAQLPMFQDIIILLPLLAYASERIISGKKSPVFILLFLLCIVDNYYMAYMTAITLVLYVIFRLSEENVSIKICLKRIFSFAVHGVISAGLSSALLIPVIIDLKNGKLSFSYNADSLLLVKNSLLEVLVKLFPMQYSNLGANQAPYIYCGSIALLLAIIWLALGEGAVRSRIAAAIILAFYFVSFILGPVDRMWHGFNDPIGFSCRYSFTFVFFLLIFAARGICFLSAATFKPSPGLLSLITAVVYVYVFAELFLNASYIVSKLDEDYTFANRGDYDIVNETLDYCTAYVNETDPLPYYRIVKNFNFSGYDGALYGYDGLDMFSSSYNSSLVRFYGLLGLNSLNNYIKESGITPPVSSLSGVGYYLTYLSDLSGNYDSVGYYGPFGIFKNNNHLPFGIFLNDDGGSYLVEDDPFVNINAIYDDLDHSSEGQLFAMQPYDISGDDAGERIDRYTFTPDEDGDYWFYRRFTGFNPGTDISGFLPEDLVYLNYYVDGSALGTYGFYINRYCSELGYLEKGIQYDFSLDDNLLGEEILFIYRFDSELFKKICSEISGFEVASIDKKGITLTGKCDSDRKLLIMLPYEKGYEIYVNGEKREYGSYRDALISLPLKAGDSSIVIRYVPAGLRPGAIVSLCFVFVCYLYFHLNTVIDFSVHMSKDLTHRG